MNGYYSQSALSISISNNINKINGQLYKSIEKLASGLKVNGAADNPAVLVISEQMRSRIASLNQEIENASMQINKYETASSSMMEMQSMMIELNALTVEAANSGLNDEAMQMVYQTTAYQIVDSYNGIIRNTQYGSQNLLNGAEGSVASIAEISEIDLSNAQAAEQSIALIQNEMRNLNTTTAGLGAYQKYGLESKLSNLRLESENLQAAESNLRDADMFKEFIGFMSSQMMLKSAIAMQAHSYIVPYSTLKLLTGDD